MPRLETKRCANWGTGHGKSLSRTLRLHWGEIAQHRRPHRVAEMVTHKRHARPMVVATGRGRRARLNPAALLALMGGLATRPFQRKVAQSA